MEQPRVGLFVTCLVDMFRPQIGFAAVKLMEEAGCEVSVPEAQTCCGQPAFNSGDNEDSRDIAKQVINTFADFDYVVAPSGSCAAMIREHYPELFTDDPEWSARAHQLSMRTYELISFLVDVLKVDKVTAEYSGKVTYHDSCSGLRELDIKQQPRQLLGSVDGLALTELPGAEVCCGFGGTFCVKYPEISNKMVEEKTDNIKATGADTLLAGDLGCLMNMAGKLKRQGSDIKVRHVAEVLADMGDEPAIAEGTGD
ncbi:(Fe-S)-binding protein [Aestuariispira ectoiniformans]|uniref:(Fe-S)-binding protein n=1 Tax=Aestuariispira ectoiniformans TaxID=2775080 RepID=UPI00223BA11F|nr:(Fe-S)-binding protein [Aestuariispira ectoiniformans]